MNKVEVQFKNSNKLIYATTQIGRRMFKSFLENNKLTNYQIQDLFFDLYSSNDKNKTQDIIKKNIKEFADYSSAVLKSINMSIESSRELSFPVEILLFFNVRILDTGLYFSEKQALKQGYYSFFSNSFIKTYDDINPLEKTNNAINNPKTDNENVSVLSLLDTLDFEEKEIEEEDFFEVSLTNDESESFESNLGSNFEELEKHDNLVTSELNDMYIKNIEELKKLETNFDLKYKQLSKNQEELNLKIINIHNHIEKFIDQYDYKNLILKLDETNKDLIITKKELSIKYFELLNKFNTDIANKDKSNVSIVEKSVNNKVNLNDKDLTKNVIISILFMLSLILIIVIIIIVSNS